MTSEFPAGFRGPRGWRERMSWALTTVKLQRAKKSSWRLTLAIVWQLWAIWKATEDARPEDQEAFMRWLMYKWDGVSRIRIIVEMPSGRLYVGHGSRK